MRDNPDTLTADEWYRCQFKSFIVILVWAGNSKLLSQILIIIHMQIVSSTVCMIWHHKLSATIMLEKTLCVCVESKVFVLWWWVSGPYLNISEWSGCTWDSSWDLLECFRNSSAVGKGPHSVSVCVSERASAREIAPSGVLSPPLAPTSGPVSFTVGDCVMAF